MRINGLNPAVATVDTNGVVTGVDVGNVVITAVSGASRATAIVQVRSAALDDPDAPKIKVEGDMFYVTDETPIPDVDITIFSTPISGTTDTVGYFYLGYTTEGSHTLIAETSPGVEVGRIPVTFTRGLTETYTINLDGSLDETYTDRTTTIFIRLQIPRSTGVLGARGVTFESSKAVNPQTGDDMSLWEYIIYYLSKLSD